MIDKRYTEGVCGDGAAILYDGQLAPEQEGSNPKYFELEWAELEWAELEWAELNKETDDE